MGRATAPAGGAGRPDEHPVDVVLAVHLGAVEEPALGGVPLQALLEVGEPEGLEQVVGDPEPDGRPHRVALLGGGDDDGVARVRQGAQVGEQVEPEPVGEVEVEQEEVGTQLGDGIRRLGARVGDADDLEPVDPARRTPRGCEPP